MASAPAVSRPGIVGLGEGLPGLLSLLSRAEKVVKMSSGTTHAAVMCASGSVYTFGLSYCHTWMPRKTICEPTPLPDDLLTVKIIDVACGQDCTFFLSDTGAVYACGLNDCGQLGIGTNRVDTTTPVEVKTLPPVKKVAVSHNHTVALTLEGEVWVSGYYKYGKLGLGHTDDYKIKFTCVPNLPKDISDVACGLDHTVLLSKSLGILVTGSNEHQQLGLPGKDGSTRFVPLYFCHNFSAIACGSHHTLALSVDGCVWAWGSNRDGQLGIGKEKTASGPVVIMKPEKHRITSLCPKYDHTALVTDEGGVLVCGRSASGELAPSNVEEKNIYELTLLEKAPGLFVQGATFGLSYTLLLVTTLDGIHRSALLNLSENTSLYEKNHILTCLECPVCYKTYSKSIYICIKGHSLCESCFFSLGNTCPVCRKPFAGKNFALQHLIEEAQVPCMYCKKHLRVIDLMIHTSVCLNRPFNCPLEEACPWSDNLSGMLDHATSRHTEKMSHLPYSFSQSLSDQEFHRELLEVDGYIFLFLRKYSSTEKRLQFATKYIGCPEDAKNFKFLMKFNTIDNNFKLEIQENVSSYNVINEELFKSRDCISVMIEMVAPYLKTDESLSCQVSIMKSVGTGK